jgi:hypothetical protein
MFGRLTVRCERSAANFEPLEVGICMQHLSDVDDIDTFLLQPLANGVLGDLLPYVEDKQASCVGSTI